MANISFTGINSGLPPNLIEQILEAERIPINAEKKKIENQESKLNLVNQLEGHLSALRGSIGELAGTRGFTDMKVISGDPNIIDGVIDPALAQSGTYGIEVVQIARKAAAVTNSFPDRDKTQIGAGYFRFDTADGPKDVFIDRANSTLDGVAAAINDAQIGMRATVINDRKDKDYPWKLVIARTSEGVENQVDYPNLYFLDGDQDIFFDETRPAQNAIIKLDGFEVELPDNTVEDVIPGVTLNLKQVSEGKEINVTVKEDIEAVSGKVKEFVDAANQVLGFIQGQNKMDQNSDTSKTLGGDSMLRSIEYRLRRLFQQTFVGTGSIKRLAQIGIEFNRNGTLDFKEEKFNNGLAKDPFKVGQFFAGDGFSTGFIPSLKSTVSTMLNGAFGPLANRKRGLQARIDQSNRKIETTERNLARREQSLRRQFANLETTLGRMKSQGAALGALGAAPPPPGLG